VFDACRVATLNGPFLSGPFLGVEALSSGRVAWLWSHRRGVIAGFTAARLHGALWLDDALPIELFWPNARTPPGISTSAVALADGETVTLGRLPASSLVRTAFDLARRRPISAAVAHLDALANAASFDRADVLGLVTRHHGVRGLRQVARVLDLHDPGAQSPKETWLRLVIVRAGFPAPQTQIPVVVDGRIKYYLDMGWGDVKIAVEYDARSAPHRQGAVRQRRCAPRGIGRSGLDRPQSGRRNVADGGR